MKSSPPLLVRAPATFSQTVHSIPSAFRSRMKLTKRLDRVES